MTNASEFTGWVEKILEPGQYGQEFTVRDYKDDNDPNKPKFPNVLKFKVSTKIHHLQQEFPEAKEEYLKTKESIKALGVTPQTTYLYIQGHHLFDNVVIPILNKVCNRLRQERQDEITRTARHHTQRRNEMSCYEHSLLDIRLTLKKNVGYLLSEQFQHIQQDVAEYLNA